MSWSRWRSSRIADSCSEGRAFAYDYVLRCSPLNVMAASSQDENGRT